MTIYMFFVVQNEEIRMIEQTDIKRLSQQNAKVRLSAAGLSYGGAHVGLSQLSQLSGSLEL